MNAMNGAHLSGCAKVSLHAPQASIGVECSQAFEPLHCSVPTLTCCVQNAGELRSALKEKVPSKIDIGPVYSQDPAKRAAYKGDTSASGFKPVERELVLDIDLTDYDDVRNSSSGTGMSRECWSLMHAAIQVRPLLQSRGSKRWQRCARFGHLLSRPTKGTS
jgi:hypothetical protein